jgi:pimeloyl-ACP methyl ester carboxylesterase
MTAASEPIAGASTASADRPAAVEQRSFSFAWQGRIVEVGYEVAGAGQTVLLLPAMSTVSSREELAAIAQRVARRFRAIATDWPGFGRCARPRLDYRPPLYLAFLDQFAKEIAGEPVAVVAAGHAAGYVLRLGADRPGQWSRIALVAPTWRGPLPTVMGGRRPIQEWIRSAIYLPAIGAALYRLNTLRPVVRAMYRGHVFADHGKLTPSFLDGKLALVRQPGARFAPASFVTGALDPVEDRASMLALAGANDAPILLIYGADTPPRSRAEMAAMAGLTNVASHLLERGALGVHEEAPDAVAERIEAFLLARPDA